MLIAFAIMLVRKIYLHSFMLVQACPSLYTKLFLTFGLPKWLLLIRKLMIITKPWYLFNLLKYWPIYWISRLMSGVSDIQYLHVNFYIYVHMLGYFSIICNIGTFAGSYFELTFSFDHCSMHTKNVFKDGATRRVILYVKFASGSVLWYYLIHKFVCSLIYWKLMRKSYLFPHFGNYSNSSPAILHLHCLLYYIMVVLQ